MYGDILPYLKYTTLPVIDDDKLPDSNYVDSQNGYDEEEYYEPEDSDCEG